MRYETEHKLAIGGKIAILLVIIVIAVLGAQYVQNKHHRAIHDADQERDYKVFE
jgi:hypothetical protein